MNEETTCSRDCNCGSDTARKADSRTGACVMLTGVITAALCATTHNEQCEAGEVCPARVSWT